MIYLTEPTTCGCSGSEMCQWRTENDGAYPHYQGSQHNQQNQSCGFWITFVELGTIGRTNGPKFATVAASVLLGAMDFELNQRKFAVEPPRIDTWKTLRWAWPQRVKMGKACFLWSSVGSPCPLIVASKQAAIAYVKSTSWIEMPSCKPSKSDFETLHLSGLFHVATL
jgi:hypothetical protein